MTPIEILTATPELTAALTAVRDELMAANSAAIASATAAVNAERDKLKADLADATKASADALAAAQATAKEAADKAAAELATANAARDKAASELAAMTAQDQKHATALLAALDWTAIDSEYTDLQTKLAANSAKYDTAREKLEELAAAINAPFAEREAAAKAARVRELEAQLAAVK
jgi:hypothetical protein